MTGTLTVNTQGPLQSGITLNCRGRLLDLSRPVVMGILNVTPDSFYDGGNTTQLSAVLKRAEEHLSQGASILDIGAVSSRPGAQKVESAEERERLLTPLKAIVREFPEAVISVDTWRAEIAEASADAGASIINDISGGQLDHRIVEVAAKYGMPYVLMHMQGTPDTMQDNPRYENVCLEVMHSLRERLHSYRLSGLNDIIIDPGFGFGKTITDNFRIFSGLATFRHLGAPILIGISRKSMIYKTLRSDPDHALNGTTALNMAALMNGASILRVHDSREAHECIQLYERIQCTHSKQSL